MFPSRVRKFVALLCLSLLAGLAWGADAPATFKVGGLNFTRPADWRWVELADRSIRRAELNISGTGGESANVEFYRGFVFRDGEKEAATDAQNYLEAFAEKPVGKKVEPMKINGTTVILISADRAAGSEAVDGRPAPARNEAMLGAIIRDGDGNIFVRMAGSAALVKGAREKFLKFITAALAKP